MRDQEPVNLLQQIALSPCSAVQRFAAYDHFSVDTSKKARVKILAMSNDFGMRFVCMTEENVQAATLFAHTLLQDSPAALVRRELGVRAEVSLAHVWELLTKQPCGGSGSLLADGSWNCFYVRDKGGTLWSVALQWLASYGGWTVGTLPADDSFPHCAGSRIFSR